MKEEYQFLFNDKTPYQLQVGNLIVGMKYSSNKKIEECVLNILKQKFQK